MAVVKTLPGVKIIIWSSGKQLKEYKNKTGSTGGPIEESVARFIEAITDTGFSFKICVADSFQLDCPIFYSICMLTAYRSAECSAVSMSSSMEVGQRGRRH